MKVKVERRGECLELIWIINLPNKSIPLSAPPVYISICFSSSYSLVSLASFVDKLAGALCDTREMMRETGKKLLADRLESELQKKNIQKNIFAPQWNAMETERERTKRNCLR